MILLDEMLLLLLLFEDVVDDAEDALTDTAGDGLKDGTGAAAAVVASGGDDVFPAVCAAAANALFSWLRLLLIDMPSSLGSRNWRGAGAEEAKLADGCVR